MAKRTRAERREHIKRRAFKHQSCDRKIGWKTRAEAEAARAVTPSATPLHVYPCGFCNRFHIGH